MTKEAENASQVILCSALEEWLCHSSYGDFVCCE